MNLLKEISLDLAHHQGGDVIRIHEGDHNSVSLSIAVYNKGTEFTLTGKTIKYDAVIAGYLAENDASGTVSGNIINIPITPNMTAKEGKLKIDVKILDGSGNSQTILFTQTIEAFVEKRVIDEQTIIDISGTTIGEKFNKIEEEIDKKIYRTKNKMRNLPAALTCWNAMSTYTSENPASPVDMPVNSWAFASGAVMAGFNNEVFTLSSTNYYWFLCIGNTVSTLREPETRHYLIWSRTGAYMFTGSTLNSAETVSWRDRSYVDVRSEINNALIGYRQVIDQLYQSSTDTTGYSIYANGTILTNEVFQYSDLISVEPNTEYLFSFHAGASSSYVTRIIGYDSNSSYTKQVAAIVQSPNVDNSIHFITSGKERYIRISRPMQSNNCVLLFSSPQVVQNNNNVLSFGPIKSYGYKGAKVSILGASISTFSGYIVEGNSAYYPHETANTEPVSDVHDTYWQKFIDALGAEILVNNSSAGSYCTTGHGSAADSKAGCGDRCEALDDGTNMPDIIIIQLGGNDFTRSTPLGSYDGTQSFPTDTTTFREAYAVMLNKITTKYTDTMILCGTIPIITGGTYVTRTFPSKNLDQGEGKPGGILLEEYNEAIRELAALFGCKVVEFSRCGMTFNNVSIYMQDYSASSNYGQHPNRLGHHLMANELLRTIDRSAFMVYKGG